MPTASRRHDPLRRPDPVRRRPAIGALVLLLGVPLLTGAAWPPIDHAAPVDLVEDLDTAVDLRLAPVPRFRFVIQVESRTDGHAGSILFEGSGDGRAEGEVLRWHLRLDRVTENGTATAAAPLIKAEVRTDHRGRTRWMRADLRGLPSSDGGESPQRRLRHLGYQWLQAISLGPFNLPAGPVKGGDDFVDLGAYLRGVVGQVEGLRVTEALAPSRVDGLARLDGRPVVAGHLDDAFSFRHARAEGRIHAAGYALVDLETGLMLDALVHFRGRLRVSGGPSLDLDQLIRSQIILDGEAR